MRDNRWIRLGAVVVLGVVAALAACVGDEALINVDDPREAGLPDGTAGGDDGGGPDAASLGVLSLAPARPFVRRSGTVDVELTIDRRGFQGVVQITVENLPTGVTATANDIPTAGNKTTLTINATAAAAIGNAPITIRATGATPLSATIVVGGVPSSVDTSFDSDGIVLDGTNGVFYAVAVQSDGKIVVAGSTVTPGSGTWIVKRYAENGAADVAFNNAAAPLLPATGAARGIAFDPSMGRIVIVGSSGTPERITILRLNADGSPDQTFNGNGKFEATSNHPYGGSANAAVVLPDSTVVIAGRVVLTNGGAVSNGIVERYTAVGAVDMAFNDFITTNAAEFNGLAVLPNGFFYAVGTDVNAAPDAQMVTKLVSTGAPDTTFAANGTRTYSSGCRGFGFALASNGDVLVAGNNQTTPTGCITRVDGANGSLLFQRSTGSASSAALRGTAAAAVAAASYAVGNIDGSTDAVGVIERRFPDGGLDPTFGTAGVLSYEDPASPDTFKPELHGVAVVDHRVVVVGRRRANVVGPGVIYRVWE